MTIFLTSCTSDKKDTLICVYNDCIDAISITGIYTKEKDDFVFHKEFAGDLLPRKNITLKIEPGYYIVGLTTGRLVDNILIKDDEIKTTGFENYQFVKYGQTLTIRYDGVLKYYKN